MPGDIPPVFVVSGASGASGELLVLTVLAQFHHTVPVVVIPGVRNLDSLEQAVDKAAAAGGTIVHTLVDGHLRRVLVELALARGVWAIDLMGPLIEHLSAVLAEPPAEQPGLYRQQRGSYFERMSAITFSVAHDDGQRIDELGQAEIVLVGVSRSGKTPLSMYLSVLGWKVANVPLVGGLDPPRALLDIDRRRVIALTIEPGQLIAYRKWRQSQLGFGGETHYTDGEHIYDEVEEVLRFCRKQGFAIVDVTDKPIESSADEVIALITRRLKN